MENKGGKTTRFTSTRSELTPREVLTTVYAAMKEKGYDPVNQIVGYLLSGDPTYITSYKAPGGAGALLCPQAEAGRGMMQRILAFDVGDRRIGVAVSDALGITAQPVETYHRKGGAEKDAEYLLDLAKRYAPCTLLFGLPRNMDGTYGEQAEKVKKFAQRLIDQWDGDYAFYDERLTTMAARRVLLDADVSREKRKQVIDKMAAVGHRQDGRRGDPPGVHGEPSGQALIGEDIDMEEKDTIVTLIDEENGQPVDFDLLLTFSYEGKRYAALQPLDEVEGVEDDEIVLLEIVKENGEESYRTIDNEILLDEVFAEFQDLFDEEDEGEE